MNKPIRTMSIVCMLLFVGLLLNSTYLQYVQAADQDRSALSGVLRVADPLVVVA